MQSERITSQHEDSGQFYGMFERPGIDADGLAVIGVDTSGQTDPEKAQAELDTLGIVTWTGPLTFQMFED